MSQPATILFVHSGQEWIRGSERVLLDLAQGLPAERFRPVIWCDSQALRVASREAGLEVVPDPLPQPGGVPFWRVPAQSLRAGAEVLRREEARLVHVNTLEAMPWALAAARRVHIPVLGHLHSPTTLADRMWSGLHQATVAVGVSRFAVAWAREDGFPDSAVRMIYNGVVPSRLQRGDARGLRAQLGIPASAMVGITVGSLIPRKDVGTVIEALRRVRQQPGGVHLLVVGDGEERPRLERQVSEAALNEVVHFLGERDDVGAVLRDAADVLIATAQSETFGLNVVEAGLFGVPSIVSDIPPHRELVTGGAGGLLFPVGDVEALANQVRQLQEDPELRKRLGRHAQERVQQMFLSTRFVADFVELYTQLLLLPRFRSTWIGGLRIPPVYWRFGFRRLLGRRSGRDKFPPGKPSELPE